MNEHQKTELKRLRRLLRQMYKAAEHASLTGAFAEGAVEIVTRYNLILQRLSVLGIDTQGLFLPLPEDASLDRVGIVSKLLSGYLEEEEDEPGERFFGPNKVIIGDIPGLSNLDELKDIGRIVRENIAEAFGHQRHAEPFGSPRPGSPPSPNVPSDEAPTQPYP